MVACTEYSVRAVAGRSGESVGHDGGISPVVSKCRKLSFVPDDAKPCRVFIILVQDVLFSGSCLDLQDSLDFLGGTIIGFFVRNGSRSFPLHLMRYLPFPTASTESAFADVAVSSICTMFFTVIAELIAGTLPACASALGKLRLYVSREAMMSADALAVGKRWLNT